MKEEGLSMNYKNLNYEIETRENDAWLDEIIKNFYEL